MCLYIDGRMSYQIQVGELVVGRVVVLSSTFKHNFNYRIGGVMVSVLASSVVYREFKPRSGQTKDYQTGICCFTAKHAALRSKNKDWLARIQDNVSEWGDMSFRGLLFQ